MVSSPSSRNSSEVSTDLHKVNRQKLLKALRQHLSNLSSPHRGFVLLQGGEEKTRYCTDHIMLFRQESYFAYLFGVREPGFYGAINVATGESLLFAPRLPSEYAVWLGKIEPLAQIRLRYNVDHVYFTDEIAKKLRERSKEIQKPLLFLLHGQNTDSSNYSEPARFEGLHLFEKDMTTLHPILTECRVVKSPMEISAIRYANAISSEAHIEVMRKARVGIKEYQLESIFLHHIYYHGGCRHCSYSCICATGENSAVLHYGHAAAPNEKTLKDGDMALFDMGAEHHFYGSDITCSFPVNGKFSSNQALVYKAVLNAHDAVIAAMKPGVSWVDMHILAEKKILASLKMAKIVVGEIDEMMAERVGAIFMPHGLGHLLGIDTHDPGGYLKGPKRSQLPGLSLLRTARKLEEGMVITVEPGCYFIDMLLDEAFKNSRQSKFLNVEAVNKFRGFGGVRIESDLYVTCNGCVNMTNVPREIEDIEAVMAGALWPFNDAQN